MSVYKPKKSPHFHYDFTHKGRRFHGSTGVPDRRTAERVEQKLRREAAEGLLDDAARMTLDQAAGKWWAEVGIHRGDRVDVERRLERVLELLGPDRPLSSITTRIVSDAVQRRRAIGYRKSNKPGAKLYMPSNATVNRDVIETLRPILKRAETHWEARGLPKIPWNELRLSEPRETFRYYSQSEREAWLRECGPECRLAVELMLTYGLRFSELFFKLDQFDMEGRRLSMMKGRKWEVPHSIPLLAPHASSIARRATKARQAGLDTIWFVEEAAGLRPLTYYGLQSRIDSAADRAGIQGGRRIHGARHHAGTTILRRTNNLKLAQKLLGHANINSTMRYAHAVEEDLRNALEADDVLSRNTSDGSNGETEFPRKIS